MYKSNQFCGSISFILMLEIIQLRGALIQNELILFMPKLPFDSPKNKLLVFCHFQERQKRTSRRKDLIKTSIVENK